MSQYQHIQGAEALQRRLLQLPAKMEAKILRGALRAGATAIKKIAEIEVPRRRNRLARTIRVGTKSRRGVVTASVKAGGKKSGVDAWYAHIIERGAKPHPIPLPRRRKGSLLRLRGGAFVKSVQHPGVRANPFMQRSLDRGHERAIVAIKKYIAKRLGQVAR